MFSKIIALFMICLMFNAAGAHVALAGGSNDKKLTKSERKAKKHTAKIKAAIRKLGAGEGSVVKVKLRDKTKVKGYISQIGDESFTVVDEVGQTRVVEYSKAKQIKGNNLHTGAWVAIGIGIGVILFLIVFQQFDS